MFYVHVEELTGVPSPEPFFTGDESENVSQSDVSVDEVIKQLDKINGNSSAAPDGIQSRALKEFKDEIAKLLTVLSLLWNLSLKIFSLSEGKKAVRPWFYKVVLSWSRNCRLILIPKWDRTVVWEGIREHVSETWFMGKAYKAFENRIPTLQTPGSFWRFSQRIRHHDAQRSRWRSLLEFPGDFQ